MLPRNLGWASIARLGLVQAALGAVVALTTSTLNRLMVVEVALPAIVPGALVTLHHAMQLLRPRMGHGSDQGRRATPWIVGGMAVLSLGGVLAAVATAWMSTQLVPGLLLAVLAFALIGGGVSAAGTSLLVLLAKRVAAERRAAAATVVWMLMIAGLGLSATLSGKMLEPYSGLRLIAVAAGVSGIALLLTVLGIWGLEGDDARASPDAEVERAGAPGFRQALGQVWQDRDARRFTLFVFISMVAYSAQDLILEPFAGSRFGFSPGASTRLSGTQHGGVFTGMLLVALVTQLAKGTAAASLKRWVVGGCLASAVAMSGLVLAGSSQLAWPLKANVFVLGISNGAFSMAAIGAMMALAGKGGDARAGVRMGLWGASQAIAFAAGGVLGTVLADVSRLLIGSSSAAYAVVFGIEVIGFVAAAVLALDIPFPDAPARAPKPGAAADAGMPQGAA